jgi:hypothetical protein
MIFMFFVSIIVFRKNLLGIILTLLATYLVHIVDNRVNLKSLKTLIKENSLAFHSVVSVWMFYILTQIK